MSRAITAIVIITLMLSIATSSGLLQFASAFVNIVSPSKGEPVPAGSPFTRNISTFCYNLPPKIKTIGRRMHNV